MINVAIMEGWASGPKLSRQFREALQSNAYTITDTLHADVIIAHSVACYAVPAKTPAQLLVLIDPPYWPGKPIVSRMLAKKHSDNRYTIKYLGWKAWLAKCGWEFYYILIKPGYIYSAFKNNGSLDFLSKLNQKSIYIVRNNSDYFCSGNISVALNAYSNVTYVQLPGEHDDYLTNPQPYIALLPKAI